MKEDSRSSVLVCEVVNALQEVPHLGLLHTPGFLLMPELQEILPLFDAVREHRAPILLPKNKRNLLIRLKIQARYFNCLNLQFKVHVACLHTLCRHACCLNPQTQLYPWWFVVVDLHPCSGHHLTECQRTSKKQGVPYFLVTYPKASSLRSLAPRAQRDLSDSSTNLDPAGIGIGRSQILLPLVLEAATHTGHADVHNSAYFQQCATRID